MAAVGQQINILDSGCTKNLGSDRQIGSAVSNVFQADYQLALTAILQLTAKAQHNHIAIIFITFEE